MKYRTNFNPYEYYGYEIRRWTKSAIDCYLRGCVCEGCFINENYCKNGGWTCKMKTAVIASVTQLGIPEELTKTEKENFVKDK